MTAFGFEFVMANDAYLRVQEFFFPTGTLLIRYPTDGMQTQ